MMLMTRPGMAFGRGGAACTVLFSPNIIPANLGRVRDAAETVSDHTLGGGHGEAMFARSNPVRISSGAAA